MKGFIALPVAVVLCLSTTAFAVDRNDPDDFG